jgi:hypothetical protein
VIWRDKAAIVHDISPVSISTATRPRHKGLAKKDKQMYGPPDDDNHAKAEAHQFSEIGDAVQVAGRR